MHYWKHTLAILAAVLVLAACSTSADEPANARIEPSDAPEGFVLGETWDGRGTDSERCDYLGQEGRTADGWIHWIYSTKGQSTNARLVLGSTGE
ncbi:MAG: hypothetical protein ABR510_14980, partial [Trueperaceae bacterium]